MSTCSPGNRTQRQTTTPDFRLCTTPIPGTANRSRCAIRILTLFLPTISLPFRDSIRSRRKISPDSLVSRSFLPQPPESTARSTLRLPTAHERQRCRESTSLRAGLIPALENLRADTPLRQSPDFYSAATREIPSPASKTNWENHSRNGDRRIQA